MDIKKSSHLQKDLNKPRPETSSGSSFCQPGGLIMRFWFSLKSCGVLEKDGV